MKNALATIPDLSVSIVIPCLNESETLADCIHQAQAAIERIGATGEVIVADNGSSDNSAAIAESCGARVVHVQRRGYGSALTGGIDAAQGHFILIGDADKSYDFGDIGAFIEKLKEGHDLIMGNRFKGGIRPGAMPWHHRFIGNPLLTGLLNLFFHSAIGDAHCGMRAFTRDAYRRMNLQSAGMEFASEMLVKARFAGLRVCEVPISYSPDGRTRPSHLKSFRDGWRHLRFLLVYSPRWLFVAPGFFLLGVGLALNAILFLGQVHVGSIVLGVHMMLLGALLALLGSQTLYLGAFAKAFAIGESMLPRDALFERVSECFTLERGILAGLGGVATGTVLLSGPVIAWVHANFGPLDVEQTIRPAILGMVLFVLGVQTIFASFLLSILGFGRTSFHSRRQAQPSHTKILRGIERQATLED